ncbi:DUF2407 C-terminal domain-containing protein [Phellopilus nigrolimitatus]|nr:DUF2407 C-terminal domain-containing protein [Phellopilus nigrolimitatus]
MPGLSEKAKGKQRAVAPQEDHDAPVVQPQPQRALTVRFTDGLPDLVLALGATDTVRSVKQQIRAARPQAAQRRLRLIYAGRILSDAVILVDWLGALERHQQRASASDTQEGGGSLSAVEGDGAAGPAPTWLHCSVGAEIVEADEEAGDDVHVQNAQIRPLRGFDRLAAAGFSEDDIANFRRTFHSQSSGNYLDTEPLGEDEDYDEHARALEEQWIDALDDGSTTSITQSSASTTILQGLLVGFFFPLLPFFFLRATHPAVFWEDGSTHERTSSVVFSKRMQMALVLGFIVNLTFGMWRYLLGS